jgi:hypothetical protein
MYRFHIPPHLRRVTELRLCMVLLEALENAQPHITHVSCSSAVFQLRYLPNDVSLLLYDEMKLRYSHSQKPNALCISATMLASGCDHRQGNIFLQLQ